MGQRISLPFVGGKQLPFAIILAYTCFFILLFTFQLKINTVRYFLYSVAAFLCTIAICFSDIDFSPYSFFYMLIVYLPFLFVLKTRNNKLYLQVLFSFQIIMVIGAFLGVAQVTLQVLGSKPIDPFSFLPADYVQQGYMTSYDFYYGIGKSVKKANGFIFLEPSFFSQFSALAIIVEAVYFKKMWRLILYFVALVVSFSGTGLLLLFWGILFVPALRTKRIITAIVLIIIMLVLFFPFYFSNLIISRVSELSTHATSGYSRFVAPYLAMVDILSNSGAFLHGLGPGAVKEFEDFYNASFTPISKIIIEYGIIAGPTVLVFIIFSFVYNTCYIPLSLSFLFVYLFLSGSLLQPQTIYFFYFLNIVWSKSNRSVNPS